jgi:hypothetical protein
MKLMQCVLFYDGDGDHDNVNGMTPRLWTSATNGSIAHPRGDIMRMENHGGMISTV